MESILLSVPGVIIKHNFHGSQCVTSKSFSDKPLILCDLSCDKIQMFQDEHEIKKNKLTLNVTNLYHEHNIQMVP